MARTYGSTRKTPAELAAVFAGDPADLAALLKIGEDSARALQQELARNFAQSDDLDRRVEEQTQRVLADWLRGDGNGQAPRLDLRPAAGRSAGGALYNKRAPGAALNGKFQDWAHFASAVWHGNTSRDPELMAQFKNFGSVEPASGGFLIPEELRSQILELSLETAIVRGRATVIPMNTLRVPIPAVDETSHAASVRGGLVGYWTEEAAQLTETEAKFQRVVLDAKKLTCYGEVPNELFQDAGPAFDAWLRRALPDTVAFFEDLAFLNGSGVGEPLGVLKGSGLISVTRTTANKILWLDILAMVARLLPSSFNRAVWVASPATLPELGNLQSVVKNVAGTENVGGAAIWLTSGSADAPTGILGRPLLFSEKVPTLGTAGDLSLVDFSTYLVGDRMAASFETSPHYKFGSDETAIRTILRVDGRPWVNSPLTPKNGGATLSPYVRLS